jgi:hypothetical protein
MVQRAIEWHSREDISPEMACTIVERTVEEDVHHFLLETLTARPDETPFLYSSLTRLALSVFWWNS